MRLRRRPEWQFFGVLPKAAPGLTVAWWTLLILSGVLPAVFAVATGLTVRAVELGGSLPGSLFAPLLLTGIVFVAMLVVNPVLTAVSMNLGNLVSAWLNERLIGSCVAPPGIGHLEDDRLAEDLTVAREFDRGHDRATDVAQRRLRRRRAGRHRGGCLVGGGAGRVRLVGVAAARARLGVDALAAPGERGLE